MTLTADEIQALKEGKITEDELFEKHLEEQKYELKQVKSAKEFILTRSRNTADCIVESDGEAIAIKIYTKLSRKQIKDNQEFIDALSCNDVELLSSEAGDIMSAKFLATLTVDEELDEEFWLQDDLDASLAMTILTAYIDSVTKNVEMVKKFR
jgi:hypothetical protein